MRRLSRRFPSKVISAATVRPFLKWAGGKRQLLPVLRRFYPVRFRSYYEPFLGSGAVFFDLVNRGRLPAERVRLTDMNADLIGCCLRLRDALDEVVAALRNLDAGRRRDPEAHYYWVRDQEFNPARAVILNGARPQPDRYTPELAAMLIYLNRTGYNGLFRLNAKGAFNVPRGRYVNPRVCDEDNLRAVAAAFDAVRAVTPDVQWHETTRIIARPVATQPTGRGTVLVAAAGTSDMPVAEEARVSAETLGNRVDALYDVGVAGLHRLLAERERLDAARVVIVVAGMEGALPSVVGGLVRTPVIAVPTSVGYGASFGGLAALLGMLNSCASGVVVVNIDNGLGAAVMAHLINHLE